MWGFKYSIAGYHSPLSPLAYITVSSLLWNTAESFTGLCFIFSSLDLKCNNTDFNAKLNSWDWCQSCNHVDVHKHAHTIHMSCFTARYCRIDNYIHDSFIWFLSWWCINMCPLLCLCRFFLKFFLKCNQNCLKTAGNPRDMRRFQVRKTYLGRKCMHVLVCECKDKKWDRIWEKKRKVSFKNILISHPKSSPFLPLQPSGTILCPF